jgi:hypothetical protein
MSGRHLAPNPTALSSGGPVPRLVIRRLPLAIAVFTLLALVACGGAATGGGADTGTDTDAGTDAGGDTGTNTGGGTGVDLCAVLTLDEVSEATGADVTDTLDGSSGNVSSCNYNTSDDGAVAGHTYLTAGGGIDPGQMIDANLEGDFAEEIDGLGDRAVLVGDESFPILMVLKNNGLYSISVLADNLDAEGKRQASIDLARIALDRLP